MKDYYDVNPITSFFEELKNQLLDKRKDNYEVAEDILLLILANNGCLISDNVYQSLFEVTDDFGVYFIKGVFGNESNNYFDYIYFNGAKYLVILMDYFKDENGEYLDIGSYELMDLYEKFINSINPINGLFPRTSMHTILRGTLPKVFAVQMLNELGILEREGGMFASDIKNLLEANLELLTLGIYKIK